MVLFTPMLWGYLADRLRRELLILRLTIAGALITMCALFFAGDFWSVAVAMLLYAMFAGPVASVAAEYDAWRHLTLRAGVRANVLWGKNYSSSTAFYGTQLTETSNGAMDSGPTPSLAATAGISIPVGPVDLDATLGGLVMGGADMQFFSRLDMRIYLP